ncbi:MAG: hypothetical protein QM650_17975 [Microlunatus sp.]
MRTASPFEVTVPDGIAELAPVLQATWTDTTKSGNTSTANDTVTIVRNGETDWQSATTVEYSPAFATLPQIAFTCATSRCGLTPASGFELAALGGTTFTNAISSKITFGTGVLAGACTVRSTTQIYCALDLPTFVDEGTVIRLARPGVVVAAGATAGTPLVTLSALVDDDVSNSTTEIVLRDPSPADNGDWAAMPKRVLMFDEADRTPQVAYRCLEPVCLSGPTSGFLVEALSGATFTESIGSTTSFGGSGTLAGVCTVESATEVRCNLLAARELAQGVSLVLPRLAVSLPSGLAPSTAVFRTGSVVADANPANDRADYRVFPVDLLADRLVFNEGFEHGQGTGSTSLVDYTGEAPGNQTYTADPAWLVTCNGTVQSSELTATTLPTCPDASATADLKDLSWALGTFRVSLGGDPADPVTNHALSSYTAGNVPAGQQIVLSGVNGFDVTPGHYYTSSFDVAARSCLDRGASYFLALVDDDDTVGVLNEDAIDPCVVYQQVLTDKRGASNHLGRYFVEGAYQATGSTLRFRVLNTETAGAGNDSGIDNLAVYDVTPVLSKSFAPSTGLTTGERSVLTFSIENTVERGAKSGWALSDTLPDGLVIADDAAVDTDCLSTTVAADPGATTISAVGSLADGSSDCEISVAVVANDLGTFSNCAVNIQAVGLIGPSSCAEVSYTIDNRPTPTPTSEPPTPTAEPPTAEPTTATAEPTTATAEPAEPTTEPTTPTAESTTPKPTTSKSPKSTATARPSGDPGGPLSNTGGPGLMPLLAGTVLVIGGGTMLAARATRGRH